MPKVKQPQVITETNRLKEHLLLRVLRLISLASVPGGISLDDLQQNHGYSLSDLMMMIEAVSNVAIPPFMPDDQCSLYLENNRVHSFIALNLDKPLSLSDHDLLALRVSMLWMVHLNPACQPIVNSISTKLAQFGCDPNDCVTADGVQYYFHARDNGAEWVEVLKEAISARRAIEMVYYSRHSGQTKKRQVYPFSLFHERGICYLRGWDCNEQTADRAWKVFRLNRIQSCELLLNTYDPARLPDHNKACKGFRFAKDELRHITVCFRQPAARYMHELLGADSDELRRDDEFEVRVPMAGCAYLVEFISQFGELAVVKEPDEAVAVIQQYFAGIEAELERKISAEGSCQPAAQSVQRLKIGQFRRG